MQTCFFHSKNWEDWRSKDWIRTICSLKIVRCFLIRVFETSHPGYWTICSMTFLDLHCPLQSIPHSLTVLPFVKNHGHTAPAFACLCTHPRNLLVSGPPVLVPSRFSFSAFHEGRFSGTPAWIMCPFAMFLQFPKYPATKTSVTLYSDCWFMDGSPVLKGWHENKASKTHFNLLVILSFSLCSLPTFGYTISNRLAVVRAREPQIQWSEIGKHHLGINISILC